MVIGSDFGTSTILNCCLDEGIYRLSSWSFRVSSRMLVDILLSYSQKKGLPTIYLLMLHMAEKE